MAVAELEIRVEREIENQKSKIGNESTSSSMSPTMES